MADGQRLTARLDYGRARRSVRRGRPARRRLGLTKTEILDRMLWFGIGDIGDPCEVGPDQLQPLATHGERLELAETGSGQRVQRQFDQRREVAATDQDVQIPVEAIRPLIEGAILVAGHLERRDPAQRLDPVTLGLSPRRQISRTQILPRWRGHQETRDLQHTYGQWPNTTETPTGQLSGTKVMQLGPPEQLGPAMVWQTPFVGALPPTALSRSSSVSSIRPAGWAGIMASSAALKLCRYSASFHARMMLIGDISLSFLRHSCTRVASDTRPTTNTR